MTERETATTAAPDEPEAGFAHPAEEPGDCEAAEPAGGRRPKEEAVPNDRGATDLAEPLREPAGASQARDPDADPDTEPEAAGARKKPSEQEATKPDAEPRGQRFGIHTIETFNNFFQSGGMGEASPRASDSTGPFADRPPKLPRILSDGDVSLWVHEIERTRLGLLVCPHGKSLQAATYDLVENPRWNGYRRRYLDLTWGRSAEDELRSPRDLLTHVDGQGEPVVLVVGLGARFSRSFAEDETTAEAERLFVESLFGHYQSLRTILEDFRQRDIVLLCQVGGRDLFDRIDRRLQDDVAEHDPDERFLYRVVPFLPILLASHFDSDRAKELEANITAQRDRGRWGEGANPFELYQVLDHLLRQGSDHLESEISRREALGPVGAVASEEGPRLFRSPEYRDAVALLFDEAGPLHRRILFCAASFPEAGPNEFEQLLAVLTRGESTEVEVEVEVDREVEAEAKFGGTAEQATRRLERRSIRKPLIELWREQPDARLHEAGVIVASSSGEGDRVILENPLLRGALLAYLRECHPMFWRHQVERIQAAGLVFHPGVSAVIFRNAMRVSVDLALADPHRFGKDWLLSVLTGLQEVLSIEAPANPGPAQLAEILKRVQANSRSYRLFLGRLSELLQYMLDHEPLRVLVHDSFDTLFQARRHGEALQLLLRLGQRLRFSSHFDILFWLHRLLHESPQAIREETYRLLLHLVRTSGSTVYELLEPLSKWLPETEPKDSPRSASGDYSLRLLLEFATESTQRYPTAWQGLWPSRYQLFMALDPDSEDAEQRLALITRWLFHPAMVDVFGAGSGESEEALWDLRADIVEWWYAILRGQESEARSPQGERLAFLLLQCLACVVEGRDRGHLVRRWRERRSRFVQRHSELDRSRQTERRELLARRELSLRLEDAFRSACQAESPSPERRQPE